MKTICYEAVSSSRKVIEKDLESHKQIWPTSSEWNDCPILISIRFRKLVVQSHKLFDLFICLDHYP